VNIPASLSQDGKRVRRFFPSREEADRFANRLRMQFVHRSTGTEILPLMKSDIASRAFAMLGEAAPETLLDAVSEYIERHNVRLASLPFEDAFKQFADAQPRSASYAQSLRQFRTRLDALHGRMLCDITAKDIEDAMTDFPPTVFNYGLRILGGLFNYGRKRDLCANNPIAKLDRRKLPPREVEIYSPKEAAALLRAADPALLPWLCVCMFAGLRASEARKLTWGDFDFVEKFVHVRAAVSKTHRPRAIRMEKNLREWLLRFRKGDSELIAPQGANVLRKQLRAAHLTAGVRQIKHGPRHCYASYLLARDGGVDALLLNMGHEDGATLFRHYHRAAKKRDAKTFWNLRPPTREGKIIPMTAAR